MIDDDAGLPAVDRGREQRVGRPGPARQLGAAPDRGRRRRAAASGRAPAARPRRRIADEQHRAGPVGAGQPRDAELVDDLGRPAHLGARRRPATTAAAPRRGARAARRRRAARASKLIVMASAARGDADAVRARRRVVDQQHRNAVADRVARRAEGADQRLAVLAQRRVVVARAGQIASRSGSIGIASSFASARAAGRVSPRPDHGERLVADRGHRRRRRRPRR